MTVSSMLVSNRHDAAGVVQQRVEGQQLELLVGALCSDAVRGVDQVLAQLQLLAVIYNTIVLAGDTIVMIEHVTEALLNWLNSTCSRQLPAVTHSCSEHDPAVPSGAKCLAS